MLNNISNNLKKEIFQYLSIIRTIQLIKKSKKYLNILGIKEEINMINFCKIYYQNDNKKISLYILLHHFKSKLPKKYFIEIYTYFMNNYIKNNPNELIELDLLLDIDIVQNIINKNLLKTNKISLMITSIELALNKNINFKNNKNIEQIYFNIISPEKEINFLMDTYLYNNIDINKDQPYYLVYYLLILKYFNNFIPSYIQKIGIPNIDYEYIKEEKILQIIKKLNLNIKDEENINYDKILKLVFDELNQYKNIKYFGFDNGYILLNNFKHNFIQNLDEIKLEYSIFKKEEDIPLFKELINKKELKNKLNIVLKINLNYFEEIKNDLNKVKFENIIIDSINLYEIKDIKVNFQNNLKSLIMNIKIYDFNIFSQLTNLEILTIKSTNENSDCTLFKYLINLKNLNIQNLYLKNDDELNKLFKTFNKYNQNLISIEIDNFYLNEMLYGDEVKLSTPLELKNLQKFSFRCSEHLIGEEINNEEDVVFSYINYYKINIFNIDKCEKLEFIRVPYYFQCNNIKVLNNLKKISIDLLETDNFKFLDLILSCKNLKDLFISFLLPFKNYDIVKYLYENIGKIRGIESELHFNIMKNNYIKKNSEINAKSLKNFEKEYIIQINNIIKNKKSEMNFIEKLYVLPTDDDYEDFKKMKYNEKIQFLKNFPILESYGTISMEGLYLSDKIDFIKEKKLFLDYFGINKTDDI